MECFKERKFLSIWTFALLVTFAASSILFLLHAEEVHQQIEQRNLSLRSLLLRAEDSKDCEEFWLGPYSQPFAGIFGFLSSLLPASSERIEPISEIILIPDQCITKREFLATAKEAARRRHVAVPGVLPAASLNPDLRSVVRGAGSEVRDGLNQDQGEASLMLTLQRLKKNVRMTVLVSNDSQAAAIARARSEESAIQASKSKAVRRLAPDSILPDYQQQGVDHLLKLLSETEGFAATKKLSLLENGCDITGLVGKHLSQHFHTYVGVNCGFENKDLPENLRHSAPNTVFISTDCGPLPFQDNSFDVLFTDNVLEHAERVDQFLRESHRVLKPGGIAFLRWGPIWTGPFGHHVHEDMVQRRAKRLGTSSAYRNDGTFIPPWGHLLFTPEQLREHLLQTNGVGSPELVDGLIRFIYFDKNLNRVGCSEILRKIDSLDWKPVQDFHSCEVVGEVHGLDTDPTLPSFTQEFPPSLHQKPILDLSRLDQALKSFPNETRFDIGYCRLAYVKR